ncbi:peptide/nickel transport system permease protein [Nocardioides zeae]|uniref:Peptide/nickel transport system permease protein n=1 Tax=Nocardioides zeae TaxID=1457234 RepID=A0ACC6IER3_9ACTN|nr:ABC transporter permease [Nocardioides zeae]MDR6174180.1 peptide/nickel transport system permease protein [Nocardioides zeae]MDR6208987.1 peptide/nickel transport system permease protein [Nocardioides zeae]
MTMSPLVVAGGEPADARPSGPVTEKAVPLRDKVRPFLRWPIVVGGAVVLLWIVVVAFVGVLAPHDPYAVAGPRLSGPSADHLLGTDTLGRDVFSRVLYGARQSLPIAAVTITVSVVIGCLVGAVAGYVGGIVDAVLMRLADVTMAFPSMLLAMAVTAALGPGLRNAFLAIIIVWWPIYARLARGQVLSLKERDHVLAARAIGMGRWTNLRKHVFPHARTPILVSATMDLGSIIILIASLSFLGLGALPPSPEWGAMITEGSANFYQWWVALGPGLAIVSVVLAINFLGDGLRDVLDVKRRGR